MLVDAVYHYIYNRAQEVAYSYSKGEVGDFLIDRWSQHLIDQVQKLHQGKLLQLIRLPDA